MMQINLERSRQYLKQFQLRSLFVEELGWDNYSGLPLSLSIDGKTYTLNAIAEKRGQVVYTCLAEDGAIPVSNIRTKIHKEACNYTLENVLVYIDQAQTEQVWQWVRRDPGKPKANRFHQFHKSQSGDALLQKLEALAVSFDEEEQLTLVDVTRRTSRAFDVDRVTKKFYERFKKEHGLFLKFITNIDSQFEREWYCSLMLNRLMFIYFIQKKGFLDGNTDYLRDRLQACQKLQGQDSFHSFYRHFLLKLFHSGLGSPQRTPKLEQLLGGVPYLNGGLFEVHQLEQTYPNIQIPDQAFENIFDFFDEYQWHLDDRPLREDSEINPDVLGYIFERYINQKEKGAYYTKEDITEYISKNTILPFLFNTARKDYKIAFQPDSALWKLLKDNPNRYIYLAVQKGVDLPLSESIEAGLLDVTQRQEWNRAAESSYALPTETWREHISRRQRCLQLRQKLADGEIYSIDDLITYNLDIRQFSQDVIESSESPELLEAFYTAICQISILDPTCGSGAFLFAALNILEPLYDGCLERMQAFVDDLKRSNPSHHLDKFDDFCQILTRVAQHPNRRYFILKSIILNNLYGVDIMEEATEICKLRLFLKLVSQVERDPHAENYGLEPLPDIDFNIRAGNTLVGFANYEEVRKAVEGDQQKKLDLFNDMERISKSAGEANQSFQTFRQIQAGYSIDTNQFRVAKNQLRHQLQELNQELNRYLADAYVFGLSNKVKEYEHWLDDYQPFHWFVEFYGIMKQGGFNVIIGNPPYLEQKEVNYSLNSFRCSDSKAIHAMCIERSLEILSLKGAMSMILPLSIVSTQRMKIVQEILEVQGSTWYANYSWRPAKLFDAVNRALTIFIVTPSEKAKTFSTNYQKWTSHNRDELMNRINYVEVSSQRAFCWVPKIGDNIESSILNKYIAVKTTLERFLVPRGKTKIYYRTTGGLYWKVFTDFPPRFSINGKIGSSSRETSISVENEKLVLSIISLLSSDIFWWWYSVTSNMRDLNPYDINNFPFPESILSDDALQTIGRKYLNDLEDNSEMLVRNQKQTGLTETQSFKIQKSKPIIDEIDRVLAQHYGFTTEETDFIINYDIKYRMSRDNKEED